MQVQFRHQALSTHPASRKPVLMAYWEHQVRVEVSKLSSANLNFIKMWLACEVCLSLAIVINVRRLLGYEGVDRLSGHRWCGLQNACDASNFLTMLKKAVSQTDLALASLLKASRWTIHFLDIRSELLP